MYSNVVLENKCPVTLLQPSLIISCIISSRPLWHPHNIHHYVLLKLHAKKETISLYVCHFYTSADIVAQHPLPQQLTQQTIS